MVFKRLPATPQADQKISGSCGPTSAKRQIVFARAALIGVPFGDRIVTVFVQPLCLLGKRRLCVGADCRGIGVEEDAVADIDGEVLRRAGVPAPPPAPSPRSAALFGVFLDAQPAIASAATSATMAGFWSMLRCGPYRPLLRCLMNLLSLQ
jgi:hypothetical protein